MTANYLCSYCLQERNRNTVKESTDLRKLAKNALTPIERKLKGLYTKYINQNEKRDREISTSNLVQMLIEESTDPRNLVSIIDFGQFLLLMTQ